MGSWVGAWVPHTLPCEHGSDYSFCLITFKLHMSVVDDERRNPIDFRSTGSKVKVNCGTLCIRSCEQDSDYSFFPNHFQTSYVSCE